MAKLTHWVLATRPKTLPAALAPVLLGAALAYADGGFNPAAAALCGAFALLVQVGTNFANDYLDYQRGADDDRIGPQRAVASGWIGVDAMRRATVGVLALAFSVGLGLIPFGGWWLLLVGLSSVACAWLYTGGPYPLAYNGLGDVFVILFFGLIAVGCTYYVQTGGYALEVFLVGLAVGGLINNILVVNNYRDAEKDARVAKRTLIVRFGRRFGVGLYGEAALTSVLVVLWLGYKGYSGLVTLGLLPAAYSLYLVTRLMQASCAEDFGRLLGQSAMVVAAYGGLLGLGLVL